MQVFLQTTRVGGKFLVRQSTICALTVKFTANIINYRVSDGGVGTRYSVDGNVKKHQ